MKRYHVELLPRADRELGKLERSIRIRLVRAMHTLADNPRLPGCKKLSVDDDLWRIRLGDYRIVSEVHDDVLTVLVVRIGHRRDVYRG